MTNESGTQDSRKETEISRHAAAAYSGGVISLLVATHNPHKTREFARLLGADFSLRDLSAYPAIGEILEDGTTFAENACLKARVVSQWLPGLILADDSGLEVDSLGGAPGIRSARYAGPSATDEANRRKLLGELASRPPHASRTARFCCVLALAQSGEILGTFAGAVEGEIIEEERGKDGFGYDPVFVPLGRCKTFAELSSADKNAISHRAVAVAQLKKFLSRARPPE